jgi:hypothetical protein
MPAQQNDHAPYKSNQNQDHGKKDDWGYHDLAASNGGRWLPVKVSAKNKDSASDRRCACESNAAAKLEHVASDTPVDEGISGYHAHIVTHVAVDAHGTQDAQDTSRNLARRNRGVPADAELTAGTACGREREWKQ